jgi:hypothetical protein
VEVVGCHEEETSFLEAGRRKMPTALDAGKGRNEEDADRVSTQVKATSSSRSKEDAHCI